MCCSVQCCTTLAREAGGLYTDRRTGSRKRNDVDFRKSEDLYQGTVTEVVLIPEGNCPDLVRWIVALQLVGTESSHQ